MNETARRQRNQQRLQELHPAFAARVAALIRELEDEGWRPRIQDAWRSPAAQAAAFESGHSKLRYGFHNVTGDDGRRYDFRREDLRGSGEPAEAGVRVDFEPHQERAFSIYPDPVQQSPQVVVIRREGKKRTGPEIYPVRVMVRMIRTDAGWKIDELHAL